MRILFDHCTPAPLRRYLSEHSVDTAYELGWETLRNGALLDLAESHGYQILGSVDNSYYFFVIPAKAGIQCLSTGITV